MDTRVKILPWDFAIIADDTHFGKWIEEAGNSDSSQFRDMVAPLIHPGDFVVEAGSYIGDQTIHYAKAVGDSGQVIAIEPNPLAFECLSYNTRNCPNVTRLLAGLGQRMALSGLSDASGNHGATKLSAGHSVFVLPLDALPLEKLTFLKLDIEGMEYAALLGARDTIAKFKPLIYVEAHAHLLTEYGSSLAELMGLLLAYGYELSNMDGSPIAEPEAMMQSNPSGMFDILARPL